MQCERSRVEHSLAGLQNRNLFLFGNERYETVLLNTAKDDKGPQIDVLNAAKYYKGP